MTLHRQCLVCGHEDLKKMPRFSHSFLVKCQKCGFVFAQKIPSLDELEAHYDTYSRHDDISPITIKRYEELLDKFESYRKNNRIIDVGCGNGHFLKVAKNRGWEVFGTEFTDQALKKCQEKGINMHKGILNPKNYTQSFDVICSFEVLEHINNPREELKNFHTILRKSGLVYLTTPNFDALSRFYLKEKWSVIQYPEHLSYYNKATLNDIFEKSGFRKIQIQTTGISLGRWQNISQKNDENTQNISTENSNHTSISPPSFRNTDEQIREKMEKQAILGTIKNIANFMLDLSNKGDTLKAFFEKI